MSQFEGLSHVGLLRMYGTLLDEFRARGILRTGTNPLSEYTQWLVAQKLDLVLQADATQGYDARDHAGQRYQIKARRAGYQLSAIRNADQLVFDYLLAVIYTHDFALELALKIPRRVVLQYAQYTAATNSSALIITPALIREATVETITGLLDPVDAPRAPVPVAVPLDPALLGRELPGEESDLEDRRTKTRDHNVEVLMGLGFQRDGNTAVFANGATRLLSPAVAQGSGGRYWFDVREANLMRLNRSTLVLVVRIVPDRFIVEQFTQLDALFSAAVMDHRANSGNVWGIYIDMGSPQARVYNIKAPGWKIPVQVHDLNSVQAAIQAALAT